MYQELSSAKIYEHEEMSVIERHRWHMAAKFGVFANENQDILITVKPV